MSTKFNHLVASPKFHTFIKKIPVVRHLAFWQGRKLYDIVGGFVYSQILLAVVELELLDFLLSSPKTPAAISEKTGLPIARVITLCNAASSINLIKRDKSGLYRICVLGASVIGVSGLKDMIKHHKLFYEDLLEPVELLYGQRKTKLSSFWPYVNEKTRKSLSGSKATKYSDLMYTSQKIVAEETLRAVNFSKFDTLLDIGGGSGAFLLEVAKTHSALKLILYDLPSVISEARRVTGSCDNKQRIQFNAGSFIDDPLPIDADVITLNRVLYDHDDKIVENLLEKVLKALAPGGMLVISEPMSGGDAPTRSGDAYFGFYTLAMTTGRPRSVNEHIEALTDIGFVNIKMVNKISNFVTSIITARKPG